MNQEDNLKQPELFDEFPKARRRQRRKLWPFKGLAFSTFSTRYENLIFGAIIILMAMVVCFTVGVERGKKISRGFEVVLSEVVPEEPEQLPVEEEVPAPVEETKIEPPVEGYAIQLITYTSKNYVEGEIAKLKKEGYAAYVVRYGRFFKILVGPYSSKEEASSILKGFKSRNSYRSAYLERVK